MVCRKIHTLPVAALLGLLLGLIAGQLAAGENLIRNGDFEAPFTTIRDIADTWTIWGLDPGKKPENFTCETNNPHGGRACMKFFRAGNPQSWCGVLVNTPVKNQLQPQPDQRYTLTFWARTDRPGPSNVLVASYRQIDPCVDGPSIISRKIDVGQEWREFQITFAEGQDFFAEDARHIYFGFFPAVGEKELNQDKTFWLDDVSLTAEPVGTDQKRLLNPASLNVPPLPLRLEKGEKLAVRIETGRKLAPVNRLAGGVSIACLGRWGGAPFSKTGEYELPEKQEAAVRDLQLPLTRLYGLIDNEPFPTLETALDQTAWLLDRLGIPRPTSMIELESFHADTLFSPAEWGRAVAYAREKELGFRYWEIGNEVYASVWGNKHGQACTTPEEYVKHVLEVSPAIKQAQPDALVGISIEGNHARWGNYVIQATAGHYDYICPHLYGGFGSLKNVSFERIVLGNNHARLNDALKLNALIQACNPGKDVFIYDSEWGMHASTPEGKHADNEPRNGNILGTVYRAIRMLYYARENVVRGASSWKLLENSRYPGFLVMPRDQLEKRTMLYWLYYYFNRSLGEQVLDLQGTAPYFTDPDRPEGPSYPFTPVLASLSADGTKLNLMLVNGSWAQDFPAAFELPDFAATRASGVLLKHDDLAASPLLEKTEDFVHELPLTLAPGRLDFVLPAHSIAFVSLEK